MTTPVGQEAVDSSRASVGELLADISSDLSTLMRQEMDLAKAEIRQSASRAGQGSRHIGCCRVAGQLFLVSFRSRRGGRWEIPSAEVGPDSSSPAFG